MTRQEHMERDLRMMIGDLMIQLTAARAEISEIRDAQSEAAATQQETEQPPIKRNGKGVPADAAVNGA